MARPDTTLALDAMGGDHGPEIVIPGAALSLRRHPELTFLICGDEKRIRPVLDRYPELCGRMRVVHTELAVGMQDKPSQALRRAKGTSMWLALDAVKRAEAQAAVSAGNTGALMALSRLILRPMAGIERPALAAQWPTLRGESIVLDVGANIGASARQLVEFAFMGAALATAHFGIEAPTVGLLNVGVEEIKGNEEVKQAHAWLKQAALEPEAGQPRPTASSTSLGPVRLPFKYHGYVEGDQIGQGVVDVVVVEGFAGNIAIKTAEGTAKQMASYLRDAMSQSLLTKAGALLAKNGFAGLKSKIDPRRVNGAALLGLNGITIKSHGATDAFGFASAIDLGYEMADSNLIAHLATAIGTIAANLESLAEASGSN